MEGETLACSNWLIYRTNVEIVHRKPLLLARFGKRPLIAPIAGLEIAG